MSMTLDTMRCPRCGGDMLTATDNYSLEQNRECICCGMTQELRYHYKTKMRYVKKQSRPNALILVKLHDGDYWVKAFFGRRSYHVVRQWLKIIRSNPTVYNLKGSYGTVWDRKHHKLRIVFGKDLPIYDDAYYEDE